MPRARQSAATAVILLLAVLALPGCNKIKSKPVELGVRGDAIRLWYSMNNRVESNDISDSRDTVVWYSKGNVFWKNRAVRSRYSLHFMFASQNVVDSNYYYDNSVGIYLMYTNDMVVRNNVISHSTGSTGMGVGFKEASGAVVEMVRVASA